jgi:hypothetical protein
MIANRAKIVLVVGVALVGSVVVPAVHAQEAKGAQEAKDTQEAKKPPDIRMLLTQPQNRVSADAAGVPDLRDVPMPKMDKPPVQPPITIVVGDPRCYPGEDGMGDSTRFNRRPRRSH